MTFAEQYEQALTITAASTQENIPPTRYFAGDFYELLDSAAHQIPTIFSGGSMEISSPCMLHFKPFDCRMLFYTQEGTGTLGIHGTFHTLQTGSLLYLNCMDVPFTLSPAKLPWKFILFSFGGGGGFLAFMSPWFLFRLSP